MGEDTGYKPESGLFKDYLSRESLELMAQAIGRAHKKFNQSSFVETVLDDHFASLELKGRINAIVRVLKAHLPDKFDEVVSILEKVAPSLGSLHNWVLLTYVELYGLEDFDASVRALKNLTQFSSAEFAIRPFMNRYTEQMLPILRSWAVDPNEHVRRLAAEGSRPRGVWTAHIEAFKKNPEPILPILELLKADPSLYVRKAVANNLNDISKDHPALVIKIAKAWKKDKNRHTDWIIKHACRSLIKKGDPRVFPIFGFASPAEIRVEHFKITPKSLKEGQQVAISFDVRSLSGGKQKLAIDYKLHYVKKNGKLSPKVFKLAEKVIPSGGVITVSTRHSFADTSTRQHHSGKHRLEIVINGVSCDHIDFHLTA